MKKLIYLLALLPTLLFGQVAVSGHAADAGNINAAPVTPGDVVGPASSTNNAFARWSGTTGKLLQNTSDLTYSSPTMSVPDGLNISSAGSISITAGGSGKDITIANSTGGSLIINTTVTSFPVTTASSVFKTGSTGGAYPFTESGHLVFQPRASGSIRDVVIAGGNPSVVVAAFKGSGGNLVMNATGTDSGNGRIQISSSTSTNGLALGTRAAEVIYRTGNDALRTGSSWTVDGTATLTGALTQTAKTTTYNAIATQGNGLVSIVKKTRVTAQSAANSSICTYTTPAADGSYEVSANMNVTASTTLTTTLTCTYTDESNTARSLILPVTGLTGSFVALGAISGAGASVWETPAMHIRCKASTVITILTSAGTFSGVTYTAEGCIRQLD